LTAIIAFANGQLITEVSGGSEPYQYLWSDGSTLPIIEEVNEKEYTLKITDANGCMIETEIKDIVASSVNLFEEGRIQMMPNPVKENLNLVFDPSIGSIKAVQIINTQGQIIQTSLNLMDYVQSLDLSNVPSGTYFIKVITNEEAGTAKFIKI
ncbi:MAG: T9SS type A sorting domain-containing protein, partial [Bacteroidota bacterium]